MPMKNVIALIDLSAMGRICQHNASLVAYVNRFTGL